MGEYFDTAVLEPGKERLEGYAQAFQSAGSGSITGHTDRFMPA